MTQEERDDRRQYKIIRCFFRHTRKYEQARCLTLDEAQAWCRNPETSSSTCTSAEGKRRTQRSGEWFDCYTAH